MPREIDIGTVLNKFNDTVDTESLDVKTFGIKFLKSDGSIREMTCRKNVKNPKASLNQKSQEHGKLKYNLKYNGVMLLQDVDIEEPRAVKPSMIFAFRDHNSTNWINVRH